VGLLLGMREAGENDVMREREERGLIVSACVVPLIDGCMNDR
jgi:hypothetical protein